MYPNKIIFVHWKPFFPLGEMIENDEEDVEDIDDETQDVEESGKFVNFTFLY